MLKSLATVFILTSVTVSCQRPFFAGSRPIGYPETPNRTTTPDALADRFGEGSTEKLPIEANGDRELIDRLSKLPLDKQPFWFINWQALEEHRKNPQTYPQKPNVFIDPLAQPIDAPPVTSNQGFLNINQGEFINTTGGQGILIGNQGVPNNNSGFTSPNISNQRFSNSNNGLSSTTGFANSISNISNGNFNNNGLQSFGPSSFNNSVVLNSSQSFSNLIPVHYTPGISNLNTNSQFVSTSSKLSNVNINNRFGDVPTNTNSNPNYTYSWNNSYHHAAFFNHNYSYKIPYYVKNDTGPKY